MENNNKRLLSDLYNNKPQKVRLKIWTQENHKFIIWLIGGVVLITTLIINIDGVKGIFERHTKKQQTLFKRPDSYKILLLPFGSSQNCTEENIICERELQNRFQLLSDQDSMLNIEVNVLNGVNDKNQATSYDRARELGDSVGANLVIWGDYKSKCEWDSTKIKIRYSIIKDTLYFLKMEKIEDYESISDITQIEQGIITGNIEDLIYIILGFKAWNVEKDIQKTIYYLNRVDTRSKVEYVELYAMLGTAYMIWAMNRDGKFIDSSYYYFKKATEIDPNYSGTYFNRGVLNRSIGCFQDALSDFDKSVTLDSSSVNAYLNRGGIYAKLNQPEKALVDYEKAISLDSTDSDVHESKGNLYQELNNFPEALKSYNKSLQLNPKNATALGNRAGIYFKTKQFSTALNDLNAALKIDPKNPHLHFNKGNIFLEFRSFHLALAEYNRATQIDSNFMPPYQNRSFIFYSLGDVENYKLNIKKLDELKKNNPENVE